MPTAFYSSESGCICSYWNQRFIAEPTYCSGCLKKKALVPCMRYTTTVIVRQLKAHVLIFSLYSCYHQENNKTECKGNGKLCMFC